MKTKLFIYITMIFTSLNAQNDKVRWNDLFSYNNVKLLEEVNGVIYCGTENGIFLFNPQNPTNDWIKLNKTNFLNNVGVSAMAYDKVSDSFLVGYENGGLDLLKSGESTMVLDIKWNGFNGDKKVNHIYISQDGIAFISGAFGIVSFDLKEEEFKETTRTNTAVVNDATINGTTLYIATDKGIYSSELSDKKLNNPDFTTWGSPIVTGDISNIELFNNDIFYAENNNLRSLNGFSQSFNLIEDLKLSNEKLIITQSDQISDFNGQNYTKIDQDGNVVNFNTAISIGDEVYGGSVNHGIINLSNLEEFYPDGPFNNKAWSVTTKNGKIWIAPGGMESYNQPLQNSDGFSYFNKKEWKNFSSKELLDAKDFVKIAVDPTDDNHFYALSYFEFISWSNKEERGIFEFTGPENNVKHITSPLPKLYRFAGGDFDANGTFYLSQSFGGSDGYTTNLITNNNSSWKATSTKNEGVSTALTPIIGDKYIFIPQARYGGIVVIEKQNQSLKNILKVGNAALPTDDIRTAALDKTGNLWIGTAQGLRTIYSAESGIDTNDFTAEPIVIIQDGIPEALLTDVGIYSIKVDNANRKWIATNGAGVYYVSESGEETKLHFTSKNSPLPSDIVYDVSIDETTGKVFFATEKGVVSYNGDVSTETNNFNDAIAYPNPYRPEYKGNITIKNLPNRALVKITDIVGNLLFEKKADGGVIEWNTNNSKGKPVASGIYLVLMTNADGTETKTLKLAVVR
ncbi:T9SS type A sorting domain-containing protein [Empedobacter falsenii]